MIAVTTPMARPGFQADRDRVILVLRHQAADIAGDSIADCAIQRREHIESDVIRGRVAGL